jgi:tol-pal system protein YbgF
MNKKCIAVMKYSRLLRSKASRNDGASLFVIANPAKSRVKQSRKAFCITILISTTVFFTSSLLHAQENPALVVDLINRVGAVEAENRELRGQLEEARHEITSLTQRIETLSADVDYRLSNPDSGTLQSSTSLPPSSMTSLPLGKEGVALSASSTATEEYERARSFLEQGDYGAAEHAFSAFLAAHPTDDLSGAAQYWLGVTFFVRGDHEKAASAFAKGYKTYPKSSKAPDNLLKLAKSLAALNRKADACTALDQLASEHPKSHVGEVSSERKKLGCQ